MANQERKKEDLYIKEKSQRRTKKFFVTSSAKMDGDKVTKTTISSSVFNEMSKSFADGDYLIDSALRDFNGPILYMLQEMQADIDDVYNEVSASAFQASFFPFARTDSGSFGVISSSFVPDRDSKYDLGSSGKEWNNLYIDGTAYVDSLDLNGSNITPTSISGSFTSLSASIATDINNAGGGGSVDFERVDSTLAPDGDDSRDLGFSNRQWRNLYLDGTANIDSLSADSFAKPPAPAVLTATKLKSSLVNVTGLHTLVLNSSTALSITGLTPAHSGQELTIMNIGSGAVTITRASNLAVRTIYNAKGASLTINQHEAYKFVCNPNQVWYQIS